MGWKPPTLTAAGSGAGKSYVRGAVYPATVLLAESKTARIVTNLPIKIAEMSAYVASATGQNADDIAHRIVILSPEVEEFWRLDVTNGGGGPWDTFADTAMDDTHFLLDEAHHFCGKHHSKAHRAKWIQFAGELRKRGASVEWITQDVKKVPSEIENEAQILIELVSSKTRRDPFFGVVMEDWFELLAKLRGKWWSKVWQVESTKRAGRWVHESTSSFALVPTFFALYESYNQPIGGGQAAKEVPKQEWEKRTWTQLLVWFMVRNLDKVGVRLAGAAVVLWLCLGGFGWGLERVIGSARDTARAKRDAMRAAQGLAPARASAVRPASPASLDSSTGPVSHLSSREVQDVGNQLPVPVVTRIVGMVRNAVIDDQGFEIAVGEKIDGKSLDSIEWERGRYVVAGGVQRLTVAPRTAGSISRPVRGGGATAAGQSSNGVGQAPNLPVPVGSGLGGGAVARAGNGQDNSVGPAFGSGGSNNRGAGNLNGGRIGSSRPSPRGAGNRTGAGGVPGRTPGGRSGGYGG